MDTLPRGFVQIARLAASLEAGLRSSGAAAFFGHAKRLVGFWSRSVHPPEPALSVAGVRRPGRLVRKGQGQASDALEAYYVGELQRLLDASAASPGSAATASAAAALRDALQPVASGGSPLTPALQSAARRLMRLLAAERPAEHQQAALRFLEARPREPLDAREWLVYDLLFGGARGPVEPADSAHLSDAGFARCEEIEVLFERHFVLRPCDGRAWPSLVGLPVLQARKLLGSLPPLLCLLVVDGAPCATLAGKTVRLPGFGKVPGRARVEQAWVVAFSALEARALCAARDGLEGDEDQGRWIERVDPHRLDTERCRDLASSRDAAIAALARAAQEAGRTRDQVLAEIVAARVEAATELPGISRDGLPHEVLRHYLAIGRPGLGANSEHLFVRQGGGPMSEGRVARILGWDVADADVRPRAMQLRNGRGAFLMLGAARGDGSALDRLGDGAAPLAFLQRVLDEGGWPWPYVEAACRRLPHASWDLALVRALLGLPPGHPFRRRAADALQRQPTWCERLEPELAARGLFEGSVASIEECAGALRETDPGHLLPLVAALADTLVVAWLQGRSDLATAWAKALLPLWPRALQGRDPAVYRLGSARGDQWFATRGDALASLQAGDVETVDSAGPARVAYGELSLDGAPDAIRDVGLRLCWTSDHNHNWPGALPRLAKGLGDSWRSCPEWVGDAIRSGLQQGQPFWCASLLWWLAEDADSEADEVFKAFLEGSLQDLLSGMAQGLTEDERARFVLLASAHVPDAPAELGKQFPDLKAASAFFVEESDRARALSQRELGVALMSAPEESWQRVERILQSGDLREVVEPCLGGLVQHVLACGRQGEVEMAARWADLLLGSWEPQLRGRCAWASLTRLELGPHPALERLLGCVLQRPNGGLPDEVLRSVFDGDAPLWAGRMLAAAVATSPRLVVMWILDGASGRYPSTEQLEAAAVWARDAGYLDAMEDGDRVLLALRLGARCDAEKCPVLVSMMHSPVEAAGWLLDRPEVAVRLSPDELASWLFDAPESAALRVACHPAVRDTFVAALGPLCERLLSDSERSERHSRWASFLVRSWAPQLRSLVAGVKIRDHALTAKMRHGEELLLATSSWMEPVDAGGDAAIEDLLMAMMRTRQGWVREWVWTARFAHPEDDEEDEDWDDDDEDLEDDGATPECLAEAPPAWVAPALARVIDAEPAPLAGSLARWLEHHPSKVARFEVLTYEALAKLGRSAEPETRLALARRLLTAANVPARLRALAWEMCGSLSVKHAAADQLLDAVLMRPAAEFLELLRAGVEDDAGPEQAQVRVAWLLDQGLAARLGSLGQGADAPSVRRDAISVDELCEQGFEPDGVVALADVARLLPHISEAAWPDCEARLIARLESAPDAGRHFWEALLDGIRDETLPADLVTGEARAQLRASFARCAAPETFGAVPPAAEVLATEWLAARGAAITEQADLLVLVAGHALASVRAHALGALAAAPLTTSQLLRAAESGHADVGAAVAARLNALQGDELNESLAAMLDSPVERVRALAIARLREAPSLSATAAVAPALLSSPHRDVEAWALAQLEDSALGADQDPTRLQELVMTRLRGGASLRAAVRARVERGAAISTSLLLRIARGPHRVDAEWAAALLVERALSGQSVPAIQLLDSEVGERPCN